MPLREEQVLVTGGAGFIGSHIVERLVRAGVRVRVYDDFSSGHRENLSCVLEEIEVIRGDILDSEQISKAARGCTSIVHQAAQLEITTAIERPIEDLRANAEGTLCVLEAARVAGCSAVYYASSAAVYGQAQALPQAEDHPTSPNWPYGVSKLACEHYARLYHEYYGIRSVGYRYAIVYGPREWYGRALTIFLRRAFDGEAPVVFGVGDQTRDFVYVEDVADCVLRTMEHTPNEPVVINVSSSTGVSIAELASLVSDVTGGPPPEFEETAPGEFSRRVPGRMRLPAELQTLQQDNRRARELFGWQPRTELRTGLKAEFEWLTANADRWLQLSY